MSRYDLVIINRSFWPNYPVLGEGLLQIAETIASKKKVAVIFQSKSRIKEKLKKFKRGFGVNFFSFYAFSNSSSGIIVRILDNFFFLLWVVLCILITRPKKLYISTDPPIIIPFVIALISKFFGLKLVYHLQDIHPEAAGTIFKINSFLFNLLKKIDNFTIKNASLLITLNEQMKMTLMSRTNIKSEIAIIQNPSIPINFKITSKKKLGFCFTGNMGRFQKISLLISAIKNYRNKGGMLEFVFVGAGVFADEIYKLSKNISHVKYYGEVSSKVAGLISNGYEWALAPIDDEISNYSFPSKISSYINSGAKILAICSDQTTVAKWVKTNKVGIVVKPDVNNLTNIFFEIENNKIDTSFINYNNEKLKESLLMSTFVKNLTSKIFS